MDPQPTLKRFTWKKSMIYVVGLTLLGISVTLIQQTNLGMSSWDALNRNFYEGIPLEYKYLNPIVALVLITIAYIMQRKKPSLWMLFPLLISFYVGLVIDGMLLVIPLVSHLHILWNVLYLLVAIVICAIGLNFLLFCKYPLPALDEFCYGIADILHLSFGKGKLIGEIFALVLAIIVGLAFSHQSDWFFIGPTTLIFTFAIGFTVDLLQKPVTKLLEARDEN